MEIKSYREGDEKAILELFEICFGKSMSYDFWKWRFRENPFANKMYIDLMWDGPKLVGHYAVCPVEMIIDSKLEQTALSMTTMTHPEYGGMGIFTSLANSLYDKLKNDGFFMVWGFPNSNSHYGFCKNLNWIDIGTIPMMIARINNLKPNENNDVVYLDSLDKLEFIPFFNIDKPIRLNSTTKYLKWRYFQNPADIYKVIVNQNKNSLLIYKLFSQDTLKKHIEIDIMELKINDINDLVEFINFILKNEGAETIKINLWDTVFSINYSILEKFGFRMEAPITYLGVRLFNESQKIADFRNWDLSFGYSDVF